MPAQRVGIITFLHNENYGSLLQAWALQQTLAEMGLEAVHLDYSPDQKEKVRNMIRCGNSPALILEGLRKRSVRQEHPEAMKKHQALDAFRMRQLRLTDPCADGAALARAAARFDTLLAGSDQIWSPEWLNERYFLTFAGTGQRRIAYAASLGVSRPVRGRKAALMRAWLRPFEAVSVREMAGAEILRSLTGRVPAVVPDPVLLPEARTWEALAAEPAEDAPYLLTYFIGENRLYWERARQIAAERNLKIVNFPVREEAFQQPDVRQCADVSPQGWLGAMRGAQLMLTDSFHGTAFACVFGKPFTALRRYAQQSAASKNSRIEQLLSDLNLPWEEANPDAGTQAALGALRLKGLAFLRSSLGAQDSSSSQKQFT